MESSSCLLTFFLMKNDGCFMTYDNFPSDLTTVHRRRHPSLTTFFPNVSSNPSNLLTLPSLSSKKKMMKMKRFGKRRSNTKRDERRRIKKGFERACNKSRSKKEMKMKRINRSANPSENRQKRGKKSSMVSLLQCWWSTAMPPLALMVDLDFGGWCRRWHHCRAFSFSLPLSLPLLSNSIFLGLNPWGVGTYLLP